MCAFEFSFWDCRLYEVTRLKTLHELLARQVSPWKSKRIQAGALVTSAPGSFDGKDGNVSTRKFRQFPDASGVKRMGFWDSKLATIELRSAAR